MLKWIISHSNCYQELIPYDLRLYHIALLDSRIPATQTMIKYHFVT